MKIPRKLLVSLFLLIPLIAIALYLRSQMASAQYEQRDPVAPAYSASLPDDAQWLTLFNGEDLQGWTPKITGYPLGENHANTFSVEDGAITVSYDDYEEFDNNFGNLFYQTLYSHYVLRLEYRFRGEQATDSMMMSWAYRNSGIMLHSQAPESMTIDQWFPVSIEAQLLGADKGKHRATANLCTPGTHVALYGELHTTHCTNSLSKSFAGDQWVTAEVEVWGGEKIRHFINDELVLEYTAPQLDPGDKDAKSLVAARDDGGLLLDSGYIALQAESHPVQFRNIRLHPIEQTTP